MANDKNMAASPLRPYFFCCLLIFGIGLSSCTSKKYYQKLPVAEYEAKLEEARKAPDSYYLIDVRTPGEYGKGHMDGAQNLNFLKKFKKQAKTLSPDRTAFIYCETAHRSPLAAKKLHKAGFKTVYDLKGGFHRWSKEKSPDKK